VSTPPLLAPPSVIQKHAEVKEVRPEKVKKHVDLAKDMFAFLDAIGSAPKTKTETEPVRERRKKVESSMFDDLLAGALGADKAKELTSGERKRRERSRAPRATSPVKPSITQPVQPVVIAEPVVAEPVVVEASEEPVVTELVVIEASEEPVVTEPATELVVVEASEEPVVTEPATELVVVEASEESVVTEPASELAVIETTESVVVEPMEEPTVTEPEDHSGVHIVEDPTVQITYDVEEDEAIADEHYPHDGYPLAVFGAGGKLVTMRPSRQSRFSTAHGKMVHHAKPGNVKVNSAKSIRWTDEFGNVVKGLEAWSEPAVNLSKEQVSEKMQKHISHLESRLRLVDEAAHRHVAHGADIADADKAKLIALDEELLLWNVVKLDLERDGRLVNGQVDGNVLDAVRGLLVGNRVKPKVFGLAAAFQAIEEALMRGDRVEAATIAKDRELWAHALVLASGTKPEFYKSVLAAFAAREFSPFADNGAKSGASTPKADADDRPALKVLYSLFSGALPDQAIQSFVTAQDGPVSLERLAKWRDILCILLSNPTEGHVETVAALGNVLHAHQRPFAAHIW